VVSIYAATVPATPNIPVTNVSGNNVVISWDIPENGGVTVTSFQILIRQSDGTTFSQDTTNCNGANL
jgi:hypothetical protein